MATTAPVISAAGADGAAVAVVVDDSGIRIGVADEHGQVRDFSGIHIGALAAGRDGAVLDFAGVRIGHTLRAGG
ncbi:hypothetical protein PSU4_25970 [Pseudonocardia sulfidoxydans NBRC 16205]|uniref:Uncharacterized protein n=1 Tax=Pseudonocardia sulfidoxydans NBRC 16205 TaxID=1223511 RepID=A0A511DGY6_9PSEU|nr:hypothetical protein [Pseudonocardia sulfidoxydans]GEL23643.1 hypothetical protein PSU4_25970 [Pseudonocardia sulfidoxydans NBRC 16205]